MDTLASYEGSTEAGRMEGEGIYTYEDGTKYVGQFKNGAFHGEGQCTTHDLHAIDAACSTHWSIATQARANSSSRTENSGAFSTTASTSTASSSSATGSFMSRTTGSTARPRTGACTRR